MTAKILVTLGVNTIKITCLFLMILFFVLYENGQSYHWTRRAIIAPQKLTDIMPPIQSTATENANCTQDNNSNQSFVSINDLLDRREKFSRNVCNCSRKVMIQHGSSAQLKQSTCSDEATLLGGGQKIISYSLYLSPKNNKAKLSDSPYFRGVLANLKGMKELYPGWIMRLYSNISLNKEMCDLVCSDNNLYYCDVSQLPELGDVRKLHPMTWRFLSLGDPTVEKFVVRDLDGRLTQRERDAVEEWEASDFEFHGMRDHPEHMTEILGGMWGANNYKLCLNVGTNLRKQLLQPAVNGVNDQQIIGKVIYTKYKQRMLIHDSYLCEKYKDSVSFPSQRHDHEFVGKPYLRGFFDKLPHPCPVKCRPKYGKDWEYC